MWYPSLTTMHERKPMRFRISDAAAREYTVESPELSTIIASAGTPWSTRYDRPTPPSVKDGSPPGPPVVIT